MRHAQPPLGPSGEAVPPAHLLSKWGRPVAGLVFVVMACLAGLVLRADRRHTAQMAERVQQENRIRMAGTQRHVEEYFNSVHAMLLYISLDPGVATMGRRPLGDLQRVFEHQQRVNQLAEIYVVSRQFDGRQPPWMVFEQAVEKHGSEEEEYRVLVAQIARFAAEPELSAQISEEVSLCVSDPGVGQVGGRGVVYSVPIRRAGDLVGVVAGMVSTERLAAVLELGNVHNMVVLAGDQGSLFGCEDLPEETRQWLVEQFRNRSVAGFFADAPPAFSVGPWTSLWTPIKVPSDQRWWLVFQYNRPVLLGQGRWAVWAGGWGSAGVLLLTGVAQAMLVLAMRRRLEEQALHHAEHAQTEEQIRALLDKQEALLQETNHRVKNNLQVVASLLDLQARRLAEPPGRAALQDSANRVRSMALIHEQLYQSRDLASINVAEYIRSLTTVVFRSYQSQPDAVALRLQVDEVPLEADAAICCGLIINELVSNALKYAFPAGRGGTLDVGLRPGEAGKVVLSVRDDGVGLPPDLDLGALQSLGLTLVSTLAHQLRGDVEFERERGTTVRITFSLAV